MESISKPLRGSTNSSCSDIESHKEQKGKSIRELNKNEYMAPELESCSNSRSKIDVDFSVLEYAKKLRNSKGYVNHASASLTYEGIYDGRDFAINRMLVKQKYENTEPHVFCTTNNHCFNNLHNCENQISFSSLPCLVSNASRNYQYHSRITSRATDLHKRDERNHHSRLQDYHINSPLCVDSEDSDNETAAVRIGSNGSKQYILLHKNNYRQRLSTSRGLHQPNHVQRLPKLETSRKKMDTVYMANLQAEGNNNLVPCEFDVHKTLDQVDGLTLTGTFFPPIQDTTPRQGQITLHVQPSSLVADILLDNKVTVTISLLTPEVSTVGESSRTAKEGRRRFRNVRHSASYNETVPETFITSLKKQIARLRQRNAIITEQLDFQLRCKERSLKENEGRLIQLMKEQHKREAGLYEMAQEFMVENEQLRADISEMHHVLNAYGREQDTICSENEKFVQCNESDRYLDMKVP